MCGHVNVLLMIRIGLYRLLTSCGVGVGASQRRTNARQDSFRYLLIYRPMLKNDDLENDRNAIILFRSKLVIPSMPTACLSKQWRPSGDCLAFGCSPCDKQSSAQRGTQAGRDWPDSAVKLVDDLAGESPASASFPVGTVVISGDGAGDQPIESPEVNVLDGWMRIWSAPTGGQAKQQVVAQANRS
jgi:hypothetical protein